MGSLHTSRLFALILVGHEEASKMVRFDSEVSRAYVKIEMLEPKYCRALKLVRAHSKLHAENYHKLTLFRKNI